MIKPERAVIALGVVSLSPLWCGQERGELSLPISREVIRASRAVRFVSRRVSDSAAF